MFVADGLIDTEWIVGTDRVIGTGWTFGTGLVIESGIHFGSDFVFCVADGLIGTYGVIDSCFSYRSTDVGLVSVIGGHCGGEREVADWPSQDPGNDDWA